MTSQHLANFLENTMAELNTTEISQPYIRQQTKFELVAITID